MNQPELAAEHTTSVSTYGRPKASLRILTVGGKIRILLPSLCPVKVERERVAQQERAVSSMEQGEEFETSKMVE